MFSKKMKETTGIELTGISDRARLHFFRAIANIIEANSNIKYFDEEFGYLTADKLTGSKITFSVRDYEIVMDTISPYMKVEVNIDKSFEFNGHDKIDTLYKVGKWVIGTYEKFSHVVRELVKLRSKFEDCYNDFAALPFGEFMEKYNTEVKNESR